MFLSGQIQQNKIGRSKLHHLHTWRSSGGRGGNRERDYMNQMRQRQTANSPVIHTTQPEPSEGNHLNEAPPPAPDTEMFYNKPSTLNVKSSALSKVQRHKGHFPLHCFTLGWCQKCGRMEVNKRCSDVTDDGYATCPPVKEA